MNSIYQSIVDPQWMRESLIALRDFGDEETAKSLLPFWDPWGGMANVPALSAAGQNTPAHFLGNMFDRTQIIGVCGAGNLKQFLNVYVTQFATTDSVAGAAISHAVNVAAAKVINNLLPKFNFKAERTILYGHSFGGAVVEAIAWLLVQKGYPLKRMQVATAGSPRPGLSSLAQALSFDGCRWMTPDDPVPYFPLHDDESLNRVAPAALLQSGNSNEYVHPYTGCLVTNEGKMIFQSLPRSSSPDAFNRFLSLVSGITDKDKAQHSIGAYISQLTLTNIAENDFYIRKPSPPNNDPPQPVPILPVPKQDAPFTVNYLIGEGTLSAYIPPAHRFIAQKAAGKYWMVVWQGQIVTSTQTKSNAKAIAKWGNKFLRVLGTAPVVDSGSAVAALSNFLGNAGMPGNGFRPVWNVVATGA